MPDEKSPPNTPILHPASPREDEQFAPLHGQQSAMQERDPKAGGDSEGGTGTTVMPDSPRPKDGDKTGKDRDKTG